jgi:hypothetical protein
MSLAVMPKRRLILMRVFPSEMPGVVSVFPNTKRRLRTTHSWDFMGLSTSAEGEVPGLSTENQENVIVGFIDTGDRVQLQ